MNNIKNRGTVWCMYYASVVSFQMHPKNDKPVDLNKCADLVDRMMEITTERLGETPWVGLQRQQ